MTHLFYNLPMSIPLQKYIFIVEEVVNKYMCMYVCLCVLSLI